MTETTIVCPKCRTEIKPTESLSAALKDKLEAQKGFESLEGGRNRKRRELFGAQDAIDGRRNEFIKRIEGKPGRIHTLKRMFAFRWKPA